GIEHARMFKAAAYHLRRRSAPTELLWTSRTAHGPQLEAAQTLATLGIDNAIPFPLITDIPEDFHVTGARLSSLTQALAYRGILFETAAPICRSTDISLDIIRHRIRACTERTPSVAAIWMSCRDPVFSRSVADFLWKCIHGAHRCGEYWRKVTHLEHREYCDVCDVPETIEHILLDCKASGQATIWAMTRRIWLRKHHEWTVPTLGDILGCSLLSVKDEDGRPKPGRTRLFKILVSEAAFLIWKTRNKRIFEPTPNGIWSSKVGVANAWMHVLNTRLAIDRTLTHASSKTFALKSDEVLRTWSGI
ncbi:hypothetical protein CERSUDRAFT_23066, partial [Gelatoporia subvermispora B]